MLITFSCDAYESIIMFGDVGKRILAMMGYADTMHGVIKAEEIPVVRARLHQELVLAKNDDLEIIHANGDDDEPNEAPVSIDHRAFTLFEMFDAAEKEKCDVVWKSS